MECRICYDNSSNEKLISPCKCTGSMKYIHKSCLDKCILYNKSNVCGICNETYQISNNKLLLFIINSNVLTSILTLLLFITVYKISFKYNITINTIFLSYFLLIFGIYYIQNILNYHHINLDIIFENLILLSSQNSIYTNKLCYLFYISWIIINNTKKYFLMQYI